MGKHLYERLKVSLSGSAWRKTNHLELNVGKTKELVIDFFLKVEAHGFLSFYISVDLK